MTEDLTRPGGIQVAQASGEGIANQEVVTVTQPPDGGETVLPSLPNRTYDLQFDPRLAQVRLVDADGDGDQDVVLVFNSGTPDESRIVFVDMVEAAQSGLAPAMLVGQEQFGSEVVVRQAQLLADQRPTLETAAPAGAEAEGTGATQYSDDLGSLIDLLDAQGVIPGVEGAFPSLDPTTAEEDEEDEFAEAVGDEDPPGSDEDPPGSDEDPPGSDEDPPGSELQPPSAFGFSVVSPEGELVGIPGSAATVGGFVSRIDVGEDNDISDNIRGVDPEDGTTTDFTITTLPDVGVLVIDRDSDGVLDEVYGLSDDFIPSAQPLPPGGLDIDTDDTVFSFLPIEELAAPPLNGSLPEASGFTYFTTDSDGLTSDEVSVEIAFVRPVTVIGSNEDDEPGQDEPHTVPSPDGEDSGPIVGGRGDDVLVGDPGGAVVVGQFNVALVADVTGSIGPENIATLNAAVASLAQQIVDRELAENTALSLITFAVRDDQATPGLVFSKSFAFDGSQFVAADGQTLTEAIDSEVADSIGSTDFEPGLQEAADFFNGLNGGSGPNEGDVNRIFFLTDGQDNTPRDEQFNPDNVPDLYGPNGLIAQEGLQISVFGIQSSGGVNSGFDPDQLNLLDDGLPPQPGEALHEGEVAPVDQVEADIGVIGFDELETALSDELLTTLLDGVGADTILGDDGDDIIFGDVPNSDALAVAQGIDLPQGSGFDVFQALEAGESAVSPDWDRIDTVAYLRDPANQSDLIGAGRGEGDSIDGGAGNDVIFGQGGDDSLTGGEGADSFVYTLAADEDEDAILDFSTLDGDRFVFLNVSDADGSGSLDIGDVVDSFVDGGGPGAVDTITLVSGTTVEVTDINGTLTDLTTLAANSEINAAMA